RALAVSADPKHKEKRPPWEKDPDAWKDPSPADPEHQDEGDAGPERHYQNQILLFVSAPLVATRVGSRNIPITPLSVQEELHSILHILRDLGTGVGFELKVAIATRDNFQRVLSAEIRPVIIHFIGHGVLNEGRTALVFEDPLGVAEPFTIEAL